MYNWIYHCAVIIMASGIFIMITSDNYLRKIVGLGIFQSAVLVFYIALAKIDKGMNIAESCALNINEVCRQISSPLPHVLMLTAIVVGFATLCVGLALIYRIYKQFSTISESEIFMQQNQSK